MSFKFKETLYNNKKDIDQIVQESSNSLITAMKDQIEYIKAIEFNDVLPRSINEQANKAIAYTLETFFNDFPKLEEHFPFEKPLFEASIVPKGILYEVQCTTTKLTLTPGTRRGHYEYILVIYQNDGADLERQTLQNFDQLKDKFIALIDRKEGNIFRLLMTNYKLDICPFIKPSTSEHQLLEQVLYAACHEEVHYLTVPMLLKQLFAYKPELDFDKPNLALSEYISELTAYSMGTLILNKFIDSSYRIDSFKRLDKSHLIKAQEILTVSEGSLSRCKELLDEEIKIFLEKNN